MRPGLVLRLMARETRGSGAKVLFFVACLAVGVAAVVAVAGLGDGVDRGIRAEARPLLAADGDPVTPATTNDFFANIGPQLLLAVVFTLVGMVLFAFSIWLVVKLAPFSVQKEIEEDQNTSLGIIMGSLILGIAIILAAAIHG